MSRFIGPVLVLFLGTALCASGQQPDPRALPIKDAPANFKPAAPQPYVITLTVSATPAPRPVLKYELMPRLRDRVPGNAALDYHRAYLLKPQWPRDLMESKALQDKLIAWEETPVDKLPVAEIRKYLATYNETFRALENASKCERCDWELGRTLKTENISMLLPEVQAQRELARFVVMRLRCDLAENKFEDAAHDLQQLFRLAKDVGEGPTLIQMLVGLALANISLGGVDQFIQRPNAPNLYWALTTLPRPFMDPRLAIEGEAILFDSMFPNLKELEKGPVSAERANLVLEDMLRLIPKLGGSSEPAEEITGISKIGLAGYIALNAPQARKELIELGRPAEEVEKMPAAQVIVLRAAMLIRTLSDEQTKAFYLPHARGAKELARLSEQAKKMMQGKEMDVFVRLFLMVIPAYEKVYDAYCRTGRRMDGLRVVEAIRLHAAMNEGKLPKSLADLSLLIPDDPYTGKPFVYAVQGNTFTLEAPSMNGEPPHAGNSFKYAVTLRK
jgi:hypothetical protein